MAVMTWPHSCSSSSSSSSSTSSSAPLLLLLWLTSLQVCAVLGNYEHTCTLDTRSRGPHANGICGKNLARVVGVLCTPRGYVSNWFTKRSAPTEKKDTGIVSEKLRGILLNKKEALSYLHKRGREPRATRGSFGSQGITCECCYNRCSYYELLQYCN